MKKRGISPLIATVLIIGFVIILAALVFTWGGNILKKTQESSKKGEIDLLCINTIKPYFLKACSDEPKVEVLIDNPAEGKIDSFLFRITGNVGTTTVKSDVGLAGFETKAYNEILYDSRKVGNPSKLEAIPYINVNNKLWACDVKKINMDLSGCSCNSGTKPCGMNIGECKAGKMICTNGKWGECKDAKWPINEICDNGKDDDCDNSIDEGCSCEAGGERTCGVNRPPVCHEGKQVCIGEKWGECGQGFTGPEIEVCNDEPDPIDNDCDGLIDEGCNCDPKVDIYPRGCYSGPDGTIGPGKPCRGGTQICTLDGMWGECNNEITPIEEDPTNGVDDDCNGKIDDTCQWFEDNLQIFRNKISDVKVYFFNQKIGFSFNNSNSLIDIEKFLVKGYDANDGLLFEIETGGIAAKTKKSVESSYYDFIALGFKDKLDKIKIFPYVGGEYCDAFAFYSSDQIDYYDPLGNAIKQVWRAWDEEEPIFTEVPGSEYITNERSYSGKKSIKLNSNSRCFVWSAPPYRNCPSIALSNIKASDLDYFVYANSGNTYNSYPEIIDQGGKIYYCGSAPCKNPFGRTGFLNGRYSYSINGWKLNLGDLSNILIPGNPSGPCETIKLTSQLKKIPINYWDDYGVGGIEYFDTFYFYSIVK